MKAYQFYDASNNIFLGQIPSHWKLMRLKFVKANQKFAIVDGPFGTQLGTSDYVNDGVPVIRVGNLDFNGNLNFDNLVYITEEKWEELQRSSVVAGDIVVAKTGATIGKSGIVPQNINKALIASSCLKVSPNRDLISPQFLRYFIMANNCQEQIFLGAIGSTRDTINITPFSNVYLPLPSLSEQQAIADFLDRKTAQIDTLIEKKQQQIDLLQEQRTALINYAVTKGLNPKVKMKDSGVEWLGEIPSHWYVVPMRRVLDVRDGTHDTPDYIESGDNAIPFVTSKDFEGDTINFRGAKYISPEDHQKFIMRSKVDKYDVLMSMIGGNIGKALIVLDDIEFSIKNVALFKTYGDTALSKYILYYIRSGLLDIQIDIQSRGGAQSFLSLSDIRNLLFFKIPDHEYIAITNFLDKHTGEIERQIRMILNQMNLIQEYRTALISEAVTGKIDVRQSN